MKIMYQAKAVSVGGRDGQVTVENSPIHFEMALPPELGGKKAVGFNPEQLFAAGYSACFGSALQHVLKLKRMNIDAPEVHVDVGIGRNEAGGFALAADITVFFKGVDQATADELAAEAHQVCPYSNATRGNVEVNVKAVVA
ncbi:MAG TPA: organic hydroperoxide resistance protein [Candidatus Limiplasma sp.]|jgi:osmotically inducible protein OsmC|nr:organic hydroperoxide resistance protein [Candidatus Limiplasma sp.]HPR77074.1 organic hydroperoxide resistance protein [Candidatus Limiplasma sp.]